MHYKMAVTLRNDQIGGKKNKTKQKRREWEQAHTGNFCNILPSIMFFLVVLVVFKVTLKSDRK